MKKERCIIIPAIKKNAVIPDQLVKKIAGVTLIQRAIDTAKSISDCDDIFVVTDSEEISIICRRNAVNFHYNKDFKIQSKNILHELRFFIANKTEEYTNIIIYRASSPLVNGNDIQNAYLTFLDKNADILVTLKREEHRIWKEGNGNSEKLIYDESTDSIFIEIKSILVLKSDSLNEKQPNKVVPYFLEDKAIEISSYQDWWICEKLLQQKKIVFVVTGYPAIGLGHVFRALTLAHEIMDHRIIFLCTTESELAIKQIAEKDYKTVLQTKSLSEDVIDLAPDLVVNDILNTDFDYIRDLKDRGIKVVNFEDFGSGGEIADLVVNALYSKKENFQDHYKFGHQYFCLRDEFLEVNRNNFRKKVKTLLITFGGTDLQNLTMQTLRAVLGICINKKIRVYIVTGPGYTHKNELITFMSTLDYEDCIHIDQTGSMSTIMGKADVAISSNGRTVFELAHMRVPAIIMSQHEREHGHEFSRKENGFEYVGVMSKFNSTTVKQAFNKLLNQEYRQTLFENMEKMDFSLNKKKVVQQMLSLIVAEKEQ